MNEKPMIVFYPTVLGIPRENIQQRLSELRNELAIRYNDKYEVFIVPTVEKSSSIKCINPRIIISETDEAKQLITELTELKKQYEQLIDKRND